MDSSDLHSLHINYKEAAIAAISVIKWGHLCANRTIHLLMDNQCAVTLINKCLCKSVLVMKLLRDMFWCSAKYNFAIKAVYVPGKTHVIADTLSRLHESGNLLFYECLYNQWYKDHYNMKDAFNFVSLCNHMSLASLCSIYSQVEMWQHLRKRWTPR